MKCVSDFVFRRRDKCKVGFWGVFVFAIVFAIVYFFVVTYFFQGWRNAKLFDDIPDLFIFLVGVLFVFYAWKKCPKKLCGFVFVGGILIAVGRLFEIPLQEYQEMMGYVLGWEIWVPVLFMNFFGYFLLLLGFRRWKGGT